MSDIIKEKREITKKGLILHALIFVVSLVVYIVLDPIVHVMYKRFIYAFMTVPMIVLLAYAMEKLRAVKIGEKIYKFFCYFGGFSLELYLVHNGITRILKYYDLRYYPPYTYYLWIFPVSIVIAVVASKTAGKIVEKASKKSI